MLRKKKPQQPYRPRLVPRRAGTQLRVVMQGRPRWGFRDLYARLLDAPWWELTSFIALLYFASNMFFACIYLCIGGVQNAHAGSFTDALFFSVQTMATIGYGGMVPESIAANTLVAIEALYGFGFFAVTAGLIFAKVSRPTARVLFSDIAVIGPYNGVTHLMLRLANQRDNRIVNANVQLVLMKSEVSAEGHTMRRMHDLRLVRQQLPFLQLTWTVMHPIDKASPLYGLTQEALDEAKAEIIVSLVGLDETFMQTVHARHSYLADELVFDAAFEDILRRLEDGRTEINYHRFHATRPLKST